MTKPEQTTTSELADILCCKCGGEVIEFSVDNESWNTIVRQDGREHDQEYLCINCLALIAATELRRLGKLPIEGDYRICEKPGGISEGTHFEVEVLRWHFWTGNYSTAETARESGELYKTAIESVAATNEALLARIEELERRLEEAGVECSECGGVYSCHDDCERLKEPTNG